MSYRTVSKWIDLWPTLALTVVLMAALLPASPAARAADRDATWTFIVIQAGTYSFTRGNLEELGTGPGVEFVVLHDPFGDGDSVCYSVNDQPGVAATEYPLSSIFPWVSGSEIDIGHPNSVAVYLEWAQDNFPADHYVISLRCRMDFFRFLLDCEDDEASGIYRGVEMAQLDQAFEDFVTRNGGEKIDILNTGFCLSAVADWMYLTQDSADYYVCSEHTSNPPVAQYWRFHRWLSEVKDNLSITPAQLSNRIVEIYGSQAYTTWYDDELSTCSAIDLAAYPAFYTALESVITYLNGHLGDPQIFLRAASETERFGPYHRRDLIHLLQNLRLHYDDATLTGLIDTALTRLDEMVMSYHQHGFRDGRGVMVPLLHYDDWNSWKKERYLEAYGSFATDIGLVELQDGLPPMSPPEDRLLITEINPGYITPDGENGDRIELYNQGTGTVDLRGLILDDGDSDRIGTFVDTDDENHALAVLDPGEYAVLHLRCVDANPLPPPANATVAERTYGVEIISYLCPEGAFLSDYDDQAILLDGDRVADCVAWNNRNGDASGTEVMNLEAIILEGAWYGSEDVAMNYFEYNWQATPDNAYEELTVDFSFIAGSEAGSLQRVWNGSAYSEGVGGMDSPADFVVSRNTSLGFDTRVNESFEPEPVPHLLITEIAPNINVTTTAGDMIEVYNAGTSVVDLYDVILTDLDPGDVEEDLPGDETPLISQGIGAGQAMLQPGKMAVITTVASTVDPQPDPAYTSYGLSIQWPAGGQFDVEGDQVVLIKRDGGDVIDSVAYTNTDLTGFDSEGAMKDYIWDNDGLTRTTGGFGFVLTGDTAWIGSDDQSGKTITDGFNSVVGTTVRFGFAQGSGGSIQRLLSGTSFQEGSPDGPPQFQSNPVPNFGILPEASLGVVLTMPDVFFNGGDDCYLHATLNNPDPPMTQVPFAVVLEVLGEYYFYPGWTTQFEVEHRNVATGSELIVIIPTFSWPAGTGTFNGIKFYGAMLNQEMNNLLGSLGFWEFGFSS